MTKTKNTALAGMQNFVNQPSPTKPAAPPKKEKAPIMQLVALDEIMPDPLQPRKHFSELDHAELLESVRTQGILQPILLRPAYCSDTPGEVGISVEFADRKYLIVCGERRFRAAIAAGMEKIPAIIRELNDDEALEAQIVENLQRKDVHPLEEALAFESLTKRGLTQEEIGARVGKGDRFVRARLVLVKLTKPWQELFFSHAIDLETALKICNFSSELQKQILADQELSKEDLKNKDLRIKIRDFSPYKGDLVRPCFDPKDPTLNPKMGVCDGCPFNTATANLFPDDVTAPRCQNLTCYKIKSDKGFDNLVAKAKEDPTVILIKQGYRSEDDKLVAKLKKDGLTVLDYDRYLEVDLDQDPVDYDNWKRLCLAGDFEGNWNNEYDEDENETDNRKRFQRAVDAHKKAKEGIEKGLKSGKYKTALVVQGDNDKKKGTMLIIELRTINNNKSSGSSQGSTPAQKVASGKATATDMEQEILRISGDIKTTEKKAVDTAHLELVKAYKNSPVSHTIATRPLSQMERSVLLLFLFDQIGGLDDVISEAGDNSPDMGPEEHFAKALGFVAPKGKKGRKLAGELPSMDVNDKEDRDRIWKFISGLTDGHLALIFRRVMADKYGSLSQTPSSYRSGDAWLIRKMIEAIDGPGDNMVDIKAIEKEVHEKAETRISRAKARIADLRKQKAEIGKKKAAPQKAAKAKKLAGNLKADTLEKLIPSAELGAVIGADPITRVDTIKKLWDYIKKHKLLDTKNRRMINLDEPLKKVLGDNPQISMFDIAKRLPKHLVKTPTIVEPKKPAAKKSAKAKEEPAAVKK